MHKSELIIIKVVHENIHLFLCTTFIILTLNIKLYFKIINVCNKICFFNSKKRVIIFYINYLFLNVVIFYNHHLCDQCKAYKNTLLAK